MESLSHCLYYSNINHKWSPLPTFQLQFPTSAGSTKYHPKKNVVPNCCVLYWENKTNTQHRRFFTNLKKFQFHHLGIQRNKNHPPHLAVLDPEKKPFERLIFPTKYVIPKSLSRLAIGQVSPRFCSTKTDRV